jgi:RNA polymerase sigma-70 factor (ECF subfamily)
MAAQTSTAEYWPGEVFAFDPELARAMATIDPIEVELLCLVAWEDLTIAQAAMVLGLKASTARMRLLRARRRLRQRLRHSGSSPIPAPERTGRG